MNIKIVQRKDRIYADGRCPLFFRFTQKRQCKYISTGIALTQEFWNETEQRITASYPDSESLNWQLKEKLAEYQKQIDKLTVLEIEVSFDTLFGQKSRYLNCTVSEYFRRHVRYWADIPNQTQVQKTISFPYLTGIFIRASSRYATVLKRSGVNIAIISESLGHSDLETTQIYLDSFENSQIDEAMKNLL